MGPREVIKRMRGLYPTGTLRSIERQGERALGRMWLRKGSLDG